MKKQMCMTCRWFKMGDERCRLHGLTISPKGTWGCSRYNEEYGVNLYTTIQRNVELYEYILAEMDGNVRLNKEHNSLMLWKSRWYMIRTKIQNMLVELDSIRKSKEKDV